MFGLAVLTREIAVVSALRCGEVKHGVAQEPIGFGPVASALDFELLNHVRIQARGDWLFRGPIEFADRCRAPVQKRGRVGKINVFVFFCGDASNVSLLLFCEIAH
jgi:hypothetical protein